MDLQLSVHTHTDQDEKHVRLTVTGRLTEDNCALLYTLIRQTQTLHPVAEIAVDLTAVNHIEATAVELIRWEIDHDNPRRATPIVNFLLPKRPGTY